MPKTTILPGTGNTGDFMSPLIPFNIIVDTDVGLLSLIVKSYLDPEVFNDKYFIGLTRLQLTSDLYERKEENPLSICIREDYKDSMDDFYKQFMEREYKEILNLSCITEYYRLMKAFDDDSDIKATIVCERKEEVDLLRRYPNTNNSHIILADSLSGNAISKQYKQFFFKSLDDAIPYAKYMEAKTIYFAAYGYNLDDQYGFSPHPVLELIRHRNNIMLTDVYNRKKLRGEE